MLNRRVDCEWLKVDPGTYYEVHVNWNNIIKMNKRNGNHLKSTRHGEVSLMDQSPVTMQVVMLSKVDWDDKSMVWCRGERTQKASGEVSIYVLHCVLFLIYF